MQKILNKTVFHFSPGNHSFFLAKLWFFCYISNMDTYITESGFKEINWDSKYIPICDLIIKDLQDRDLTFLHAHYWQGKTDNEIAPAVGLQDMHSMQIFKTRIFARCRMLLTRKAVFLPMCLKIDLMDYSKALFTLSQSLRRVAVIKRIENDSTFRDVLKELIVDLIVYIKGRKITCDCCENRNKCEIILKTHNKKCKTIHKVLDIEDYTLEKNLENHKKLLGYLLSWKVFDASNKRSV